jgi:DMSO/TMAO reductase YedYZ molybdopterin-dependent catalytic subunit
MNTRRDFLKYTAAAVAGVSGLSRVSIAAESAGDLIPGKHASLIVHGAQPAEIETPLKLLREHRLTPKELLFVRNNQNLTGSLTLEPAKAEGWKIELSGLLNRPAMFDVAALTEMEQVDREIVLQCSGNGRAFFSQSAPAKGAPWSVGAMANVRFSGVPLAKLLGKLGVEPTGTAKYVAAEGRDAPDKGGQADFEHSLPLEDVLERSILALRLNGEPIPAVHGGPVRLITPGFYGTMNVKWLSRLRFEENESTNHHHRDRYRTPKRPIKPGEEFQYNLANSEANWPMRIKSVIFSPLDGEQLSAGKTVVKGVAFNDGAVRIDAVQLSTDGGATWRRAKVEMPDSPYAWHPWQLEMELPRGETRIMARAVDQLGRTQPLEGAIHWNPAGYAWSGVHAVSVRVG